MNLKTETTLHIIDHYIRANFPGGCTLKSCRRHEKQLADWFFTVKFVQSTVTQIFTQCNFLSLTSRTCLRHSAAGSTAGCSSAAGKNPFQQPAVTIQQPVHSVGLRTKPTTSINRQPDTNNPQQHNLQPLEWNLTTNATFRELVFQHEQFLWNLNWSM